MGNIILVEDLRIQQKRTIIKLSRIILKQYSLTHWMNTHFPLEDYAIIYVGNMINLLEIVLDLLN